MATFQERINQSGGSVLIRGRLTAQGSTTVSDAITDMPRRGVIRRMDFRLASGAGSTIDPQISRSATVFTVPDLIAEPLSTAAASASSANAVPFLLDASELFVRPQCDSGSNNVVDFELEIDVGTWR